MAEGTITQAPPNPAQLEAKIDYLMEGLQLIKDDLEDKVARLNSAIADLRATLNRVKR